MTLALVALLTGRGDFFSSNVVSYPDCFGPSDLGCVFQVLPLLLQVMYLLISLSNRGYGADLGCNLQ